jgi:hypothetical protein
MAYIRPDNRAEDVALGEMTDDFEIIEMPDSTQQENRALDPEPEPLGAQEEAGLYQ